MTGVATSSTSLAGFGFKTAAGAQLAQPSEAARKRALALLLSVEDSVKEEAL